jgi:hypothetical protein
VFLQNVWIFSELHCVTTHKTVVLIGGMLRWPQAPRSSSPGRVKNYLPVFQTGAGGHPTSYPIGTGGSFPGSKAAGA